MKETKQTKKTKETKTEKAKKVVKKAAKKVEKVAKTVSKKSKTKENPTEETIVFGTDTISEAKENKYAITNTIDEVHDKVNQLEDNVDTLGQESTRLALDLKNESAERKAALTVETSAREVGDETLDKKLRSLNKVLMGALITWGVALILIVIFFVLIFRIIA